MFEYAQKLGQEKRANPQDDVWTILSTVEVETDDGERTALSQIELDMFFILLIVAGSETTRNAVSQGLLALLDHPDQLERLRREPGAIPLAVEEILRWSSPVSYFARRATRDTEIRGVPIAEGDRVTMWYPSANRDEDVFDDPFRFDITPEPEPACRLRRRRCALLPRGQPGPTGARDAPRGAVRAHSADRAGGSPFLHLARASSIPIMLFMRELPVRVT